VPILARIYRLDPRNLDSDIQLGRGHGCGEPEACQGSSSGNPHLHDPGQEQPTFSNVLIPYSRNIKTLNVKRISSFEFIKMIPYFPQSMFNLRSLTLELDYAESWDTLVDPFESLTHTLESLELINVPLSPSLLAHGSLTRLTPHNNQFDLPLDTLLNFLEENRSLTSADLRIKFIEPSSSTRSVDL